MKMQTLKGALIRIAALVLVTATASAEHWHGSTVNWIYPQADGSVVITFNTSDAYCQNPASPKYYTIKVGQYGVTQEGLKNMLATALLAKSTGATLNIAFTEVGTECWINRLFIQ